MRSPAFVACVALVLGSCTNQSPFDPDSSTILSGAQTTALEPCTGVSSSNDVWNPSELQISELEEHLFTTLAANLRQIPQYTAQARDYYRQYVGFMIGGHKIIYVSGFHRIYIESLVDGQRRQGFQLHGADWRREAVCAFDGGPMFFSGEYDVDAHVFRNFAFNPVGG